MRRVMWSVLVGVVLLGALDVGAAEWEEDTLGWWAGLPAPLGVAYLAGALEVLDAVGLACPAAVTVGEVETRLRGRLGAGEIPAETRWTRGLLLAVNSLGCRFDGLVRGAIRAELGGR